MKYQENQYIIPQGLWFKGVLNDIKKSSRALQPIFEAFTNSLEAIKIRAEKEENYQGEITLKIHAAKTTDENATEFRTISIIDNGVGFNSQDFDRFNTYKDDTKGFKNRGSGRIQFVHYFGNSKFTSIFRENDRNYKRSFIISKSKNFLSQNAIVLHLSCEETDENNIGTEVRFEGLLENSNVYNTLDDLSLKEELAERYIYYFCHNRESLPKITLQFYVQGSLKGQSDISDKDFPSIDKSDTIYLPYSQISKDGNSITKLPESEEFTLDAFKVSEDILKGNDLKLVSKGEVVEESNVVLQSLAGTDKIDGFKYLFLVSSNYIDERDTDIRGKLSIPSKDSLSKLPDLFNPKEIFIEDIQDGVNEKINQMYPEIKKVQEKHNDELERLKEMFFLDEEAAKEIKISLNDNEGKILEKFYEVEAKKKAKVDAYIKQSFDRLEQLDTRSDSYADDLQKEASELAKVIPLQNKHALTQYVARRKLVLELFDKILDKQLVIQQTPGRNFNEALIHNLLFQQGSENPENSDLWILNEDFIYFKGSSEKRLSDLTINDKKIFKDKFTEEEERYLNSLGEKRLNKKPDVLLFPEEGKCIILEFKAPDVNVSDHLTQIDKYASFLLNYTKDEFRFNTFYGYLIGESIEKNDVLAAGGRYEESFHFDYFFRPSEPIRGFNRPNASIYTEVIKYSTLLLRAKRRNQIYMGKLHQEP